MAGRGPAPKDGDKRARRNADPTPAKRLRFRKGKQPPLPARMPDGRAWPTQTRTWWKRWAASAQAERFTDLEWSYLLDTALLHGQMWAGDSKVAAELRLRLAKFGATPDDMQRLRVGYDTGTPTTGSVEVAATIPNGGSARERYGDLRLVPGGQSTAGA